MARVQSPLGRNIASRCQELGITVADLAAAIGMNKGNLSRIMSTGAGYSARSLKKIADGLQWTEKELFETRENAAPPPPRTSAKTAGKTAVKTVKMEVIPIREMVDEDDFDPATGVMIPVSDMDVSGGPGVPIPEFAETRYKLHFTRRWLKDVGAREDEIKVARVRGESMQPTLWDDDKVVIHLGMTRIRNERLFAIAYAGEARVKRLHMLADGRLRVQSDNPDKTRYPDEFIDGDDLNNVLIIGQVIHKMGEGGL